MNTFESLPGRLKFIVGGIHDGNSLLGIIYPEKIIDETIKFYENKGYLLTKSSIKGGRYNFTFENLSSLGNFAVIDISRENSDLTFQIGYASIKKETQRIPI